MTEWAHAQNVHVTAARHWAELAGAANGRRLAVLDDGEVTGDLMRDMIQVLTSFCAPLYRCRLRGTVR